MKNHSIKRIVVLILASAAPVAVAGQALADAIVTDSMCGSSHKNMKIDSDDRCVRSCVRAGAKYVLWDRRSAYVLSDQKAAERWAGK